MKQIAEKVRQISSELDDAQRYAEESLYRKAYGDSFGASRYKEMAQDELKHAGFVHDMAVQEIAKVENVYKAPADMQEQWEKSQSDYVQRAALVKQMLAM